MFRELFTPDTKTAQQIDNTILTGGVASLRVAVQGGKVLRLVNTHATQTLHINFGDGTETAIVAADMIIPPGSGVHHIVVPISATSMSYIASGATTVFHLTKGQ